MAYNFVKRSLILRKWVVFATNMIFLYNWDGEPSFSSYQNIAVCHKSIEQFRNYKLLNNSWEGQEYILCVESTTFWLKHRRWLKTLATSRSWIWCCSLSKNNLKGICERNGVFDKLYHVTELVRILEWLLTSSGTSTPVLKNLPLLFDISSGIQ